jgi:hypothetical protein
LFRLFKAASTSCCDVAHLIQGTLLHTSVCSLLQYNTCSFNTTSGLIACAILSTLPLIQSVMLYWKIKGQYGTRRFWDCETDTMYITWEVCVCVFGINSYLI